MPFHPQAQAVADFYAAVRTAPFETLGVDEARATYAASNAVSTEVVYEIRDVQAGTIPCRLYRPSAKTDLGLLVYFHGGGWTIGDLNSHDGVCRSLANKSGHAVLAVDYRLAPEHIFPAAYDDCVTAVKWAHDNASALGIDNTRLAVGGDSAGGNLAAAVALAEVVPLKFQMLIYPSVDMSMKSPSINENADAPVLTKAVMLWFGDNYMGEKLSAPPDFNGPTSRRHFTDILCTLLLWAMWISMTGLGIYAMQRGDYRLILHPLDYAGNRKWFVTLSVSTLINWKIPFFDKIL